MNQELDNHVEVYFAPVLPWQQTAWNDLLKRYDRLPHGLLFAGMQGIGKRAFVWRFVAWLLCDNREQSLENVNSQSVTEHTTLQGVQQDTQQTHQLTAQQGACGHCQSCLWLSSGTHPDLKVLPQSRQPIQATEDSPQDSKKTRSNKKPNKSKPTKKNNKETPKTSIKVDDIRELQPFISQGSTGRRVCVIDNADTMTVAAANALLKTLEEPRDGIHLLLISDMPAKLLPTIKSRVQQVTLDRINREEVIGYLSDVITSDTRIDSKIEFKDKEDLTSKIEQSLKLSNGAPLAALDMLSSEWYQYRDTWIKAWLALRAGKRSSIAASDYWQKTLSLDDFLKLSEFMLMDFSRQSVGIKPLQHDTGLEKYDSISKLKVDDIQIVMSAIEDNKIAVQQNVQDKMVFDQLMSILAAL